MKIQAQTPGFNFSDNVQKMEVSASFKSAVNSSRYADENNIQKLDQKNIIDGYFKIFEETHTEVEIKNLISARLQPAYKLPEVHDHKALSHKAKELLNFSLSV